MIHTTYTKGALLLMTVMMLTIIGQAQTQGERIWLNNALEHCKKKHATHYITVDPQEGHYTVEMYDMKHRLKMRGVSLDPQGEEFHGPAEYYHTNGAIESAGEYRMGAKVGAWQRYDRNGGELAERMYAPFDHTLMAYTYVEEMPRFEGGEEKFSEIMKHMLGAIVNETESDSERVAIEIEFIVSERGEVTQLEMIKGLSPEWNQRALAELARMPTWIPGKNAGENVRVKMRLPIDLSL